VHAYRIVLQLTLAMKLNYINNLEQVNRTNLTLFYRLMGCKFMNEDNLLKLHGSVLKLFLIYYFESSPRWSSG
jgi:hypothetical protein